MILNKNNIKLLFSYGVGIFPLFLLIGPLVSELFLILIIIFATIAIFKDKQFVYFNRYLVFFGLFYISTVFSTLINFYNFDYTKGALFYFRIPLFAFSIWFVLSNSNIFNKRIVLFYTLFFSLIIFDAIFQYFTGYNIIGNEILRNRISSFFSEELILGGFFLRLLPVFLVFLIMSGLIVKDKINIFYSILISFICLIIYLSGERTSFFLLALFFGLIFISIKDLRKFIIVVGIISVFLSFTIPYLKNSEESNPATRMFKKSYEQIIGRGEEQYEGHKKKFFNKIYAFSHDHHGHYMLSIRIIKDYPFFGTGIKGFRYLCRNKIYILEKNDGCSTHPHNTYFQIFTSNGFVGFAFLLFAFFYVMRGIFKSKKKINFNNNFNKDEVSKIILLVGIFINLWPLIPSGNFFNNWLSMLYFYPIGFYLYFRFKNEK
mgnify:FL=1|tara:strand:+ start:4789 stop:6084 length:1296 start_codon:yes stop_codon:yes gene_type:complete